MKLPEYDNRTPNTPLYQDSSKSGDWENIKYPAILIAAVVAIAVGIGATVEGVFQFLRSLFH